MVSVHKYKYISHIHRKSMTKNTFSVWKMKVSRSLVGRREGNISFPPASSAYVGMSTESHWVSFIEFFSFDLVPFALESIKWKIKSYHRWGNEKLQNSWVSWLCQVNHKEDERKEEDEKVDDDVQRKNSTHEKVKDIRRSELFEQTKT